MNTTTTIDRRQFLGSVGAAGATASGLTLGLALPEGVEAAARRTAGSSVSTAAVNSWLTIGSDETVTLTIGSSDMGQGSFQGLAQVLCEDLMVSPTRVVLAQGKPTMAAPAPIGTAINTVGSGVTRNNFWKLRDAGALAREMLVSAAMAAQGDATRGNYSVSNGIITHTPSGTTYSYGQVAAAAALLPAPTSAALVPDSQFTCIGKSFPRADIPFKVDGSAVYGLDVRLTNMVYAIIKHAPTVGSTLAVTPAVPSGMLALVPTKVWAGTNRGGELAGNINAVAVVGTNTWDTWQAAKRVSPQWTLPANAAQLSTAQFLADAQSLMTNALPYDSPDPSPLNTLYTLESVQLPNTSRSPSIKSPPTINSTYSLPYVAHATLEVLNCTVDYVAGVRCDVWAPTQSAKSALSVIMAITGMTAAQVTVHTTFLGGGLGRKAEVDFISQAVQVGMALGRPVKLMWPREEDFAHDQYRPAALVNVRATLSPAGIITKWIYRNVSPSILGQRGATLPPTGDSQGTEGSNALPYAFTTRLVEWVRQDAPIPVGFWRSVGASINTFAVESAIDELATSFGQDAYQFRRTRITDPRWLAVLDAAASAAGWSTAVPAGSARGIAIGTAFNTIVAQVVEISGTATNIKVNKVTVAVDCYLPVNPQAIEAQIIGGVVHGMNAALWGRQTFLNGAAQVKNFNNSRMMRISEAPAVKVVLMPAPAVADRTKSLGGVGELGVPTFAPALAAAFFKLTGVRQRSLPFFPNATMSD